MFFFLVTLGMRSVPVGGKVSPPGGATSLICSVKRDFSLFYFFFHQAPDGRVR
jgi:hypothetical protein